MMEGMRPDLVAPVVAWLCHESCQDNGSVIEAAAGWAGKRESQRVIISSRQFKKNYRFLVRWQRARGCVLRDSADDPIVPEAVRDNWDKITDFTDALYPKANEASLLLGKVLQDLWEKDEARKNAGSSAPLSPIVCHSRNCPINRMIAFFSLNGRSKL